MGVKWLTFKAQSEKLVICEVALIGKTLNIVFRHSHIDVIQQSVQL